MASMLERWDDLAQEMMDRRADARGIKRGPGAALLAFEAEDAGRMVHWYLLFGEIEKASHFAKIAFSCAEAAIAPEAAALM